MTLSSYDHSAVLTSFTCLTFFFKLLGFFLLENISGLPIPPSIVWTSGVDILSSEPHTKRGCATHFCRENVPTVFLWNKKINRKK